MRCPRSPPRRGGLARHYPDLVMSHCSNRCNRRTCSAGSSRSERSVVDPIVRSVSVSAEVDGPDRASDPCAACACAAVTRAAAPHGGKPNAGEAPAPSILPLVLRGVAIPCKRPYSSITPRVAPDFLPVRSLSAACAKACKHCVTAGCTRTPGSVVPSGARRPRASPWLH